MEKMSKVLVNKQLSRADVEKDLEFDLYLLNFSVEQLHLHVSLADDDLVIRRWGTKFALDNRLREKGEEKLLANLCQDRRFFQNRVYSNFFVD
jgi:hypothetical protein